MKSKPAETEIFINECSLQGQFQTATELEKAVASLISILELIIGKSNLDSELYKGDLFLNFEAIKNEIFQRSFNTLQRRIQDKFKDLIRRNLKDWRTQRLHQSTDKYTLIQDSQNVTDTSIAEIAERKLQKAELAYLLVNFSGSNFQISHPTFSLCRLIAVSKNQAHPRINLDCLDNKKAFEEWVQDKLDTRNFLEREIDRFEKTSYIVQGQPVYIETQTERYWYLDNFHKNHFEVFNKQGKHLGEADLKGVLDTNQQNKTKIFKC